MAGLLETFSKPINRAALTVEEAAPSVTSVRNISTNFKSSQLNPLTLASIMKRADDGDATAYLEMAELVEERDTHYQSVMGTRKRAVTRLEFTVESAGTSEEEEADAQMIRDLLDRDELQSEVFNMLDAIGKGYSCTEIIWKMEASQWVITDLKLRDPRWFEFDRNDGQTLRLKDGGTTRDLTPYKYITHFHQAKSGIPIRGGVIRSCSWMYLFKNFSIKDWMIFTEAYGQPIRLGKYGPGANADDRAVLLRAVSNIGSDFAAILPEGMNIEFIESQGKTASADLFERLARFADEQMSKAVLGQTTTTDAIGGGGIAGNQSHGAVRSDICDSDAIQLATTLNKQLVPAYIRLNRGERRKYPRIRIGQTELIDKEKESVVIDRMVRAGAKISEKEILKRFGLPAAKTPDDILTPIPSATPTMMAAQHGTVVTAAVQQPQGDAINTLASQMANEWEDVLTPVMNLVDDALKDVSSFEEFSEKLLQLASKADLSPGSEKIARSVFAARLAGNVGSKLK